MLKQFIVVLVAVALVATFAVSKAEANGPDYTEPATLMQLLTGLNEAQDFDTAFGALSTEAQEAVMLAVTPVSEEVEETVVDHALAYGSSDDMPACRTHTYSKHKKNALGWKIATYKSWTWWCRLNGKIHGTPDHGASGQVYTWARAIWKFKGHDFKEKWIGPNRAYHRDRARGRFDQCTPTKPKVCYRAWTVTINKRQNGSGTQSAW